MITLTILNADGTTHWVEHFNDIDSCNNWLKEEQTRSYWKQDYTWQIVDESPTPEQIAQQEAIEAEKQLKKQSAITKLKTIAGLTDDEISALLRI